MLKDSQVAKDISTAKKIISKLNKSLDILDNCLDNDNKEELIKELFNYENIAEQLVNNARLLPIATGLPQAKNIVTDSIISENNVQISYTKEGWFYVNIPSLLPKKEKGSPSYIRATLDAGIKNYFSKNEKIKFKEESIIIFKHNYSKERTYREYRDHDNIELNAVVDIIALHVLIDDCPMRLKHFYCSAISDTDRTEVFIVPEKDFINWLEQYK